MPFISKDWRSPGEEWVKTVEGWEKKKILECANNKTLSLLLRYVIVPRSVSSALALFLLIRFTSLSLFLALFSARPRSLFVSRLRAAHSCYSSVYIDPTDSPVCLHARARIVARGLHSPIPFVSRKRDENALGRGESLLSVMVPAGTRDENRISPSSWPLRVCILTRSVSQRIVIHMTKPVIVVQLVPRNTNV